MATVMVYGASDDLAEIEGDFYDEFPADIDSTGVWVFDTGTQIEMDSDDDGNWRLRVAAQAESDTVEFGHRVLYPGDMTATVTGQFTEVLWMSRLPRSARKNS